MSGFWAVNQCFATQQAAVSAYAAAAAPVLQRSSGSNSFIGFPYGAGSEQYPAVGYRWSCVSCGIGVLPPPDSSYSTAMPPCQASNALDLPAADVTAYTLAVVSVWLAAAAWRFVNRTVEVE